MRPKKGKENKDDFGTFNPENHQYGGWNGKTLLFCVSSITA